MKNIRLIVLLCLASFLAGFITEASADDIKYCCDLDSCYPAPKYGICKPGYF